MKKSKILALLIPILSVGAFYLCMSFFYLTFNAAQWDDGARYIVAVIFILSIIPAVGLLTRSDENKS